jgi:alpha-glucosidase
MAVEIPFVPVRDFTPNLGAWTPVGAIRQVTRAGDTYTLALADGQRTLQVSFPSPRCFRVRFDPAPNAAYASPPSSAVVQNPITAVVLVEVENSAEHLVVDTGAMRVEIGRAPYAIRVFRGAQLVSADEPSYNLVYIPGQRVIANVKTRSPTARYCGFGEKAGAQVLKTQFTMTQFNYDDFKYVAPTVPAGTSAGPLNPSIALYVSIPFMLEINPQPSGPFAGPPYACGVFLDNPAQTYFNMGSNDYSNMDGKYYFGALYGTLDYYFFVDDRPVDVIGQYTSLTGRAPMPPKYVLGFHQGSYGYFNRQRLEGVAQAYRNARIPCDGLHIDVDFQDNYRTFTHSEMKFPNPAQMLAQLRAQGFKCSTNITPLITRNPLDENAQYSPYPQRNALLGAGGLIYDTRAGEGLNPNLFEGQVNYGVNRIVPGTNHRFNPYPSPGLPINSDGSIPLSSPGNYPDLGRADIRKIWGDQYKHLVQDLGMAMIWQDMMCPALDSTAFSYATLPLNLMINDGTTYVPEGVAHNAYALFILMGTWDGLQRLRPETRNFIIARGGYAGVQRYAAVWTGDSGSSWEFLRINLPEVLNLGLSGVPLSGCDIGGFAADSGSVSENGTYGVTNYELLTRWMHLGSFLPWYRNHYDGYNKSFQEPYRYGEPVPTNCRKYVELRYRMLQLYYDALYEWTQSGMPPVRALFLNEENDPAVYDHLDDQFFVGRDFLVAPILFPGQGSPPVATRSVYLPAGSRWYAFMDGTAPLDPPVPGGTTIASWRAALDEVPIYVREGAIIPMRALEQYVGELAQNPLDINVYPGRDTTYTLYQDDSISTQAAKAQAFRITEISHQQRGKQRQVRLRRVKDGYRPPEPYVKVSFLEGAPGAAATVDGAAVAAVASRVALDAAPGDALYYDAGLRMAVVKVMDTRADVTVSATTP